MDSSFPSSTEGNHHPEFQDSKPPAKSKAQTALTTGAAGPEERIKIKRQHHSISGRKEGVEEVKRARTTTPTRKNDQSLASTTTLAPAQTETTQTAKSLVSPLSPTNTGDEYNYWMAKIKQADYVGGVYQSAARRILKDAPYHIRNNNKIMLAAVTKDSWHFQNASPTGLIKEQFLDVIKLASPRLRNDKQFVTAVVRQIGRALKCAPKFQNDRGVVMAAVGEHGLALEYASPSLRNDIVVVMSAVKSTGLALTFASPSLQNNKQVVLLAFQAPHVPSLQSVSSELRKCKQVVMTALQMDPNAIKYVHEDLKRDPDVLTAASMFDSAHDNAVVRKERENTRKIVFSTRFSLKQDTFSEATRFTVRFKKSTFYQGGNYTIYTPNAFDKKTCDREWTRFDWPCRGTKETCQYNNVLTDAGYPTDECCWRYSFRSQLQEAKSTGGFMIQLVETDPSIKDGLVKDATLGMGQRIELDMANAIGVKVFQVYRPEDYEGRENYFFQTHIDAVVSEITRWYDNDCRNMSVSVIHQDYG